MRSSNPTWQRNDAAWFASAKRKSRTHRLRRLFDGEIKTLTEDGKVPEYAGYRADVIVRQLRPGIRMRRILLRNPAIEIPDVDAVIRAMFDLLDQHGSGAPRILQVKEVADLAMQYEAAQTKH